jgi:hypothetical protein
MHKNLVGMHWYLTVNYITYRALITVSYKTYRVSIGTQCIQMALMIPTGKTFVVKSNTSLLGGIIDIYILM